MTKSNRGGQISNSSEISTMSTVPANFRKIRTKLNELCWWQNQIQALYQQSRGCNSSQFSNSSEMSTMPLVSAIYRKIRSKLNTLSFGQGPIWAFWALKESKINDQIRSVFNFLRDSPHFHLIYKLQGDPIKTEQGIVRTRSNMFFCCCCFFFFFFFCFFLALKCK